MHRTCKPCCFAVLALTGLWLVQAALAGEDLPAFASTLPAQSRCVVEIAMLHPTEIALGMKEVEIRSDRLKGMSPPELTKYLNKHAVSVIIGPGGMPYIVDGQHLVRALITAGIQKPVPAKIQENWSDLAAAEFWDKMKAGHLVYLFDETGKGPLTVTDLPHSVKEMHNDPYRSLAWEVRLKAGYLKTEDPAADFTWANFFRTRIQIGNKEPDDAGVVSNAVALAHSPEAKELPGYLDRSPQSRTDDHPKADPVKQATP